MGELKRARAFAYSRTLFMLFSVIAYWIKPLNISLFIHLCVFVMAPWGIATVVGELYHRQIPGTPYHGLLFAMSGIFLLSSLYNLGVLAIGLSVFAALCAMTAVIYHVCRDTGDARRNRRRRAICLIAFLLVLAAILPFFVSFYNGKGWTLPWMVKEAVEKAPRRGGGSTRMQLAIQAFEYNRLMFLNDLAILIFVCGAMLVAGIQPKTIDAQYARREGGILLALITALSAILLLPAVVSVFIGAPVVIPGFPEPFGLHWVGAFNDRITALQHANMTSHYALIGVFSAVYCLCVFKRRHVKVLLLAVIVLFLIATAHCQSRTTNIAMGAGFGALVFRCVFLRFEARRWRIPVGLLAGVLTVGAVMLLINALFTLDVNLSMSRNAIIQATGSASAETQSVSDGAMPEVTPDPSKVIIDENRSSQMKVSRAVTEGSVDVFSTGRNLVWAEGMDYLIHHPKEMVFGMGAGDLVDRLTAYNPSRFPANHLHSGFLETLAHGGIFMLLCLIAWLIILVRPTARLLTEKDDPDRGAFIYAVFIGVLLTVTLAEALLFVRVSLANMIFFYAASRAMAHHSAA